jgi:formylglycine-generating enzyme required for sulfatase activity
MYMAPEQALGHKLDQRADLFSLGSVLYQMVSGRPPFRASTTVAVLKRVAEDKARAIREIIPETPQWLCDIIAKLHAKNPDDRYQSAREVADVLADCEAQLKANAKLKDYSRIPCCKPQRSGRRKWVAATAALLPVLGFIISGIIALAVLESAGVTHLLRGRESTPDPLQSVDRAEGKGPPPQNPQPTAAPLKYGDPEYTNTLGMKFKLVPAGKFTMGSSQQEIERLLEQMGADAWLRERLPAEGPEHPVEITQPFYMGATEVTVGQFRQFVDEEGYQVGDGRWRDPGFDQTDKHPVVWVSWNNAVDFCKWLAAKEGRAYRLPTEAEWEYSCRAGKAERAYCFGDDEAQLGNYAWYTKNSGGGTHPVGKKKPNDWALYDMHGNAWEWCQDNYDPDYYKNSPMKDPPGGAGAERVIRGGSWGDLPAYGGRSAFRNHLHPADRFNRVGFRVLLVSPPASVRTESGTKDKPSPTAIAPFTDADVQRIASLPAAEQVEQVRQELKRRNPGFDGKMEHKIEGGVVTELRIVTDKVTDIAPIRVFDALRVLECGGTYTNKSNGLLADLTPLEGMNLAGLMNLDLINTKVTDVGMVYFKDCKTLTHLRLERTQVGDAGLAHFKDCKTLTSLALGGSRVSDAGLIHFKDCKDLTHLDLAGTKVSDVGLAHFKNCKNLTYLHLDHTQVGDAGLAQFMGMPLMALWIDETGITDLNPLQGMPLEDIRLTPKNITKGLDILRDMKSLKTIGISWTQFWPAARFWERYDKGEFKE